jgi:hypothetical protein
VLSVLSARLSAFLPTVPSGFVLTGWFLLFSPLIVSAQTDGSGVLQPVRIDSAPVLDGVLDEEVWTGVPICSEDFISYWTVSGEVLPYRTRVWAAYDADNLYFAFSCSDPEPGQMTTSIRSRDNIWEEDWVGLGLDAAGNGQGLYQFYVNPNGIQGDRLYLATTRTDDVSVDWVWYCGARIVDDGYTVEIRVPLRSFRFQSGDEVRMGVTFIRRINRLNLEGTWPEVPVGQSLLGHTQTIGYRGLNSQRKVEILPAFTSGSIQDRLDPDHWTAMDTVNEVGISMKYSLTSSLAAEATLNPDFSQVESDAFQIEVNQRYPLFFTEKRPFFMESGNLFSLSGTSEESNMRTTVHTRYIVDPQWGAKLTGEVGRTTFSLLGAGDESAGREYDAGCNPYPGQNADFLIGRWKRSLGGENYTGVLYSGREWGGSYNRVAGADLFLRFGEYHSISSHVLHSITRQPATDQAVNGNVFHLTWDYRSQPLETQLMLEHFDDDFDMATAYFRRTGFSHLYYYLCPLFYPDPDVFPYIRRLRVFTYGFYRHNWVDELNEYFTQIVINPFMAWNGWFRVDANLNGESWGGVVYHKRFYRFWSGVQFTRWLNVLSVLRIGDAIYYDPVDHYKGDSINWRVQVTLQPTGNFNQFFSYVYETLENPATGRCEYNVHVLQSRTTYQFNEYFFVRALLNYDSHRGVVLTDLLASFTLIPGTVMHLGYGSLHENLEWRDGGWFEDSEYGTYYQRSRSIFFKASYLFRL